MPSYKNLEIMRGDDVDLLVNVKHQDGTPYNFAGCKVDFVAKVNLRDSQPALALSTDTGEIRTGEDGALAITIPHAATKGANWSRARYDLQLTTQADKIKTILSGDLVLLPDVA